MNTIALDFDGVIHRYSKGWQDGEIYDPPVVGSLDALRTLMDVSPVFIFTARDPKQVGIWLMKHNVKAEVIPDNQPFWNKMGVVGLTNRKLPATVYVDDRGLQFKGVWDLSVVNEILTFRPVQAE